ncbi:MAG: hypothetical protein IT445_03085 [Phycisphaeraceae bacterium]|nr:hypothetical protein [Phycisphaeraceae bacterium]
MASARNNILDAFKTIGESSFSSGNAVIGVLRPADVGTTPKLEIWWQADHGSHVESNSQRVLRVTTALKFKYDSSVKSTVGSTQLHQASERYDAFHAAVETAFNTRKSASTAFTSFGYLIITQEEPGIQCDGFDDEDEYVRIGEVWRVTYRRTQGAAI